MEEALEWIPGGVPGALAIGSAVALGTYYAATRQKGEPPMFPLDEQSFLSVRIFFFLFK